MGKKGTKRKTRWRVLPIGGEDGCNGVCSNNEDDGEGDRDSASPPNTYARASSQRIPRSAAAAQRNGGGYNNYRHRSYQHQNSNDSNHQPLVTTEKKKFNEEEYTKITTPRQDVLFKKGYLGRKKPEVTVSTTANTNVATTDSVLTNGNGHACDIVHNGDGLEGEIQTQVLSPMEEQPQYVYMDQGAPPPPPGVYYINGSGYELYDPYSGNVTVVVGPAPPHYAGAPGAGPPVLAAVPCQPLPLQPIEWFNPAFLPYVTAPCPPNPQHHRDRRKRYSTDSQNCSPQSSESTGPPGSPQECELEMVGTPLTMAPTGPPPSSDPAVFTTAPPPPHYIYPGYMFGPPMYSVNGVTVQGAATQPPSCDVTGSSKRRKKKRRKKRRRAGDAEDGSEESSSDEKDLEEPVSVTSQGSELECDKRVLNEEDEDNNNNNNISTNDSSSSSSTSTSSLSPPCQAEISDFQPKVKAEEEEKFYQGVSEVQEIVPKVEAQECEIVLVQDSTSLSESSSEKFQKVAASEECHQEESSKEKVDSIEKENTPTVESKTKPLQSQQKTSQASTDNNRQQKKGKGKNKNKTSCIAADTCNTVLKKGGKEKAGAGNCKENQQQKPSKKSQKKNKTKQTQNVAAAATTTAAAASVTTVATTPFNGHTDNSCSNINIVTEAEMDGNEKESKDALRSEGSENSPEEAQQVHSKAEPFSLRPDAPKFDHHSTHNAPQHVRDTSGFLDSITEVLAKDPSSIAGAQKSLLTQEETIVKTETSLDQEEESQPTDPLVSHTEVTPAENPNTMGECVRSRDSPVPPPRRKKTCQSSPSFTKRKSAERRSPTPGRDLSGGSLTDDSSSSSTTHESEDSVIDLLSCSTHTSPDDERNMERQKSAVGLVSSDEEADNVIYRSEESKPPDKAPIRNQPRSLDIVSRPSYVATKVTTRYAEEMSGKIIAEAVLESARQKPITMAVTRWLRSQSPEAVLTLPTQNESEVSSSEDDYLAEVTNKTGPKNVHCNPLPALSHNSRLTAPGHCVDDGGRGGRRVASKSYTDGNITDNKSISKLINENEDPAQCEKNVQDDDGYSFSSENQECEWDHWDCNPIPQVPRIKTPDEDIPSQMYDPVLSVPKYYYLGASQKKATPSSSASTSTLSIESSEEEEMDALKHFQHELAKEHNEKCEPLSAELAGSREPLPISWGIDASTFVDNNNKRRVGTMYKQCVSENIAFVTEANNRNSRFGGPARLFQHSKSSIIVGTLKGNGPFPCGGICCILQ